jgi:type III secretion protein F
MSDSSGQIDLDAGKNRPDGVGSISDVADGFTEQAEDLHRKLNAALAAVQGDSSNATALANYQSLLSEYTLYRNAQSNTTKALKDIDSSTISNFR